MDGNDVLVDTDGNMQVILPAAIATPSVAVANTTASGTNQQILAAQGSGVKTRLHGLVVTTDTATDILLHWGDGTTDPVMVFDHIEGGGVAYHYGLHGLLSDANEALKVDVGATADVRYTVYYTTE